MHPSPMMEPPPQAPHPPPPTAGISISGGFVVMSFHGVPPNDAYVCGFDPIKTKRGPKTKQEFTFSDEVPLLVAIMVRVAHGARAGLLVGVAVGDELKNASSCGVVGCGES